MQAKTGFTLIELIVVVAIIAILSSIVLFIATQYIGQGKDSSVEGNLVTLIPAGEAYYNVENSNYGNGYNGFCSTNNSTMKSILSQIPLPGSNNDCTSGICCFVDANNDAWAACAQEFANTDPNSVGSAYCVDSRGVQEQITNNECTTLISSTTSQCPAVP